jgi:CHAD domain-containing protein
MTRPGQPRRARSRAAPKPRDVALDQLERWAKVRDRLVEGADPDALHDFRVALRRLRSTLRAFRTEFAAAVPSRTRRRLRRLARASGRSRDLQVQQAWVREQRASLPVDAGPGIAWVLARLEERQRAADARFARRLPKECARIERRLRRALEVPGPSPPGGPVQNSRTDLVMVRRMIREGTAEFRRELRAIHTLADRNHAHAARIAAKRLRYLLEPFAAELPGAEATIAELTAFQDLLGELQDAHTLAGELRAAFAELAQAKARRDCDTLLPWPEAGKPPGALPGFEVRAGLVALSHRLSTQCDECFARLDGEWLGHRAGELVSRLSAIGAARSSRPRRRPSESRVHAPS